MPQSTWTIDAGGLARLQLPRVRATVDPSQPNRGVFGIICSGTELARSSFLAIDCASSSSRLDVDCYERSGDLVATYPQRANFPLRWQVYWRAESQALNGALAAVELVAAVQTNLLDSCPKLTTRSTLLASQAFQLSNAQRGEFAPMHLAAKAAQTEPRAGRALCFLFRFAGQPYSYAEMVHPLDAHSSQWLVSGDNGDMQIALCHQLFTDQLEKGVILKSRVLGVLLDRAGDMAAAFGHYRDFAAAALPLTT